MKKPETLKRVLLGSVPSLAADPMKLAMFIDKGKLKTRASGSLSFEYGYTLNIVVEEYGGDVDALMIPLLAWVSEMQPDLLERAPNEPFTFDCELLDGDLADVSINLELTEAVRVVPRPAGGYDVTHLAEPVRCDAFGDGTPANLWKLLLVEDMTPPSVISIPD